MLSLKDFRGLRLTYWNTPLIQAPKTVVWALAPAMSVKRAAAVANFIFLEYVDEKDDEKLFDEPVLIFKALCFHFRKNIAWGEMCITAITYSIITSA